MTKRTCVLIVAVFSAYVQAIDRLPSFEAVSIKPAEAPARVRMINGGPETSSPGEITCSYDIRALIRTAFDVPLPWQWVTPSPLPTTVYDIVAKVPAGATRKDLKLMLQNLLIDRFGLVAHKESREMSIYELVVAKGGPKLREPAKIPEGAQVEHLPRGQDLLRDKSGSPILPPGWRGVFPDLAGGYQRYLFRSQPVSALAGHLERMFHCPVVDKTGLTGEYDFELVYDAQDEEPIRPGSGAGSQPQEGTAASSLWASAPVLIGSLERQLGLKLVSGKGPVEVLVVNHVNPTPTPD